MPFSHFSNPVAALNPFTIIMLTLYLNCKGYTALFDVVICMPFVLKTETVGFFSSHRDQFPNSFECKISICFDHLGFNVRESC